MSIQENRAIVARLWQEIYNQGEIDVVDEIVAEDYLGHDRLPGQKPGSEGMRQYVRTLRGAFPDLRFSQEDTIASDDMVVTRWHAQGTHRGEYLNVPASGRRMTTTGMTMHRLADGKIVEGWTNWDALGMLAQIGVLPLQVDG